jgi:hypothetical protein
MSEWPVIQAQQFTYYKPMLAKLRSVSGIA